MSKIIETLADAGLDKLPNWPALESAARAISRPADQQGFDWNPFNEDLDGLSRVQEIQNNAKLVRDVTVETVTAVEHLAAQAAGMASEEKLELAVDFLAPIIKGKMGGVLVAARFLVKPILRHIISAVVDWLNRKADAIESGKSFLAEAEAANA